MLGYSLLNLDEATLCYMTGSSGVLREEELLESRPHKAVSRQYKVQEKAGEEWNQICFKMQRYRIRPEFIDMNEEYIPSRVV